MKKPIAFLLLCLFCLTTHGQENPFLKVGIKHEPPFVIIGENQEFSGLSVDLWESIAKEKGVKYEMVAYNDQLGLIRALDFGDIDLTINPIHVNEVRMKLLDVTQPFFVSSIGVATSEAQSSQVGIFIRNFFSLQFLRIILFLIGIIFVFGTLLWLAEHKQNRRQFRPNLMGLFDGLWWSAVTMTTVGYGDKAPKTKLGRVIAMVWMFSAIVLISGFTATVASTLTVNSLSRNIEDLEDLRNTDKLGSVIASNSEHFLRQNDITVHTTYDDLNSSLTALAASEIEVLVYDKPVLDYLITQLQITNKVSLLPVSFNKQYRSFLLPKNSQHTAWIDPLLVRKLNEASWQELLRKYDLHY
jgi:polar amino acid transport system substrate-binding protein